jgi:hypothetical protein
MIVLIAVQSSAVIGGSWYVNIVLDTAILVIDLRLVVVVVMLRKRVRPGRHRHVPLHPAYACDGRHGLLLLVLDGDHADRRRPTSTLAAILKFVVERVHAARVLNLFLNLRSYRRIIREGRHDNGGGVSRASRQVINA